MKVLHPGVLYGAEDRSIRIIADQHVQPVAHGPGGFDNLHRRLASEYHDSRIGASIVVLRNGRNECNVVHDKLKSSLAKGLDRRRSGELQCVCDKSNRLGQFDSPVVRMEDHESALHVSVGRSLAPGHYMCSLLL